MHCTFFIALITSPSVHTVLTQHFIHVLTWIWLAKIIREFSAAFEKSVIYQLTYNSRIVDQLWKKNYVPINWLFFCLLHEPFLNIKFEFWMVWSNKNVTQIFVLKVFCCCCFSTGAVGDFVTPFVLEKLFDRSCSVELSGSFSGHVPCKFRKNCIFHKSIMEEIDLLWFFVCRYFFNFLRAWNLIFEKNALNSALAAKTEQRIQVTVNSRQ